MKTIDVIFSAGIGEIEEFQGRMFTRLKDNNRFVQCVFYLQSFNHLLTLSTDGLVVLHRLLDVDRQRLLLILTSEQNI